MLVTELWAAVWRITGTQDDFHSCAVIGSLELTAKNKPPDKPHDLSVGLDSLRVWECLRRRSEPELY